jgi:hypothetical protein
MVGERLGTRLYRLLSVDLPRSHDARHDESREPRERPAAAKPSHPARSICHTRSPVHLDHGLWRLYSVSL